MADNVESVCDTARFDSLSPDNWSGVMLRNSSRTTVKGLTLYVENASAFYVDIKSLRKSEPNRIYSTGDMEPLLDEALLCTPERRGFYGIDLGDKGIFSSCSGQRHPPGTGYSALHCAGTSLKAGSAVSDWTAGCRIPMSREWI